MAKVVPTVLATSPAEYDQRLKLATSLSPRVHIDICDGQFADNPTISLAQVHFDTGLAVDLHLMVKDPASQIESALSLHPELIIFHAESNGDLASLINHCHELDVKAGVAILPETTVDSAAELIKLADHVLIFTGHLGHNGGQFQAGPLEKIAAVRQLNPSVEVGVDGGVTDVVAKQIVAKDADVLFVGAYLQSSPMPEQAYDVIQMKAEVPV
ncbi:MAG TPA: hypothetical protein VLF21_03490 [Candidatus Saccharimonadales bacterium]|nr:hypothetical protein [Candidatus Saccharimonadales bacterium]